MCFTNRKEEADNDRGLPAMASHDMEVVACMQCVQIKKINAVELACVRMCWHVIVPD